MNSHLVTVEVGVKRRTNKRMQLNGLAFDENRLKRLHTQTVKGRSSVENNRVLTNDVVKNVPDLWLLLLNHALCRLNGGHITTLFQLSVDEWLKELDGHGLWQTALMQFEFRT